VQTTGATGLSLILARAGDLGWAQMVGQYQVETESMKIIPPV